MKLQAGDALGFWAGQAYSSVEGLQLYLQTLEKFIESERSAEIHALEKHAGELPDNARSDFWAWNYPVHWDDIFATQLRCSFLVTLVSLVESHVSVVASEARGVARAPLSPRELQGEHLERHRKYFEKILGFQLPGSSLWSDMHDLSELRNRVVHAQNSAHAEDPKKQARLLQLAKNFPGISVENSSFQFSAEFPLAAINRVKLFLSEAYGEAGRLVKGSNQLQDKGGKG